MIASNVLCKNIGLIFDEGKVLMRLELDVVSLAFRAIDSNSAQSTTFGGLLSRKDCCCKGSVVDKVSVACAQGTVDFW